MQTYRDKLNSSFWVFQSKRGTRDRLRGCNCTDGFPTRTATGGPYVSCDAPYSWNFQPSTLCWEINCLGLGGITKTSSTKDLCITVQRCISFPTARGSHFDLADVILFVQAERSL